MKRFAALIVLAMFGLCGSARADDCTAADLVPGKACDVIRLGNVTIHNGDGVVTVAPVPADTNLRRTMDMCEYARALYSPGSVVTVPVHIRGVTDDRNNTVCAQGRWIPLDWTLPTTVASPAAQ